MKISQVIWGNVLRSSSAELSYRRTMRSAVRSHDVAIFLLEDPDFPRGLLSCLGHMQRAAKQLPNGVIAIKKLNRMIKFRCMLEDDQGLGEQFRDCLNEIQLDLNQLHILFSDAWFSIGHRGVA